MNVVLNALAIEFVYDFDKEIGRSHWYDPDRRFIRAGTIEMVLREELLLEPFYTNKLLCDMYDIDEQVYAQEVGGPLKNADLAAMDVVNPMYITPKDKLWRACAVVALEENNEEAIWQFDEKPSYFGIVDRYLKPKLGGIFNRYEPYCTWSRWDKVLWLPEVPEIGQTSKFKGIPTNHLAGKYPEHPLNFDPNSNQTAFIRFAIQVRDVLVFKSLVQSVTTVFRRQNYHHIVFRAIDGLFEWFVFAFVVFLFPSCLVFYLFLIFGCEPIV